MQKIASFDIQYHQFLDSKGQLCGQLPAILPNAESLIPLYESMLRCRIFDTKAIALQRTGQLGTYPSSRGHEAVQMGIGFSMKKEDVFVPSYREHGTMLMRGVTMADILLFWGGDERGSDFAVPKQDFPISIPIATHLAHAVGVAKAFQLRGEGRVAVAICGDGGTSKGDFYEAMNFAGVWKLPVVFVVSNNRWAISVPLALQTATQTLAQKAVAAGIPGVQVDGNDVVAVAYAVNEAVQRARDGGGPALVEALTYRVGDHTTADDARRYRSEAEVEKEKQKDPLLRVSLFLRQAGLWSDEQETHLSKRCAETVEQAVKCYLETPPQEATSMFDYLYAHLPKAYQEQREAIVARSVLCHKSH